MTEQTETIDTVSDSELFKTAIEEVPKEAPKEQPTETEERARDPETGRFVAKEPESESAPAPQEQPAPQAEEKPQAQVPSWRLAEEAENRRREAQRAEQAERQSWELQRQLAELQRQVSQFTQQKQEPVDFWADPQAALKQELTPIEQRFHVLATNLTLRASRAEAVALHGKDAVANMENAVEAAMRSGNPEMQTLALQMRQSDDPVGVAMRWYQQDKLLKDTGGDLETYKKNLREQLKKDPEFRKEFLEEQRAQASPLVNGRPNVQLPPSLNRATGAQVSDTPTDEDMSDRALFRHAIRSR